LDVEVTGEGPPAALLELGAEPAQDVERRVHGPADVLGGRDVLLPVGPQHGDLEPAKVLAESPTIPGNRSAQASGILRVVAGEGLECQGAVLDGAGQRPAVIERVG